jgi:hypothetical protein
VTVEVATMSKRMPGTSALEGAREAVNASRWELDRARVAWEDAERDHAAALERFMAALVETIETDDQAALRELAREVRGYERDRARPRPGTLSTI